jgi:hypothetical protein
MIASKHPETQAKNGSNLDLYSTSQKSAFLLQTCAEKFFHLRCTNRAPFFAYQTTEKGFGMAQGNCHSWSCPRCGIGRAKQEYGRIVEGCRTLAEDHKLYFLTLTCRGKEMSWEQAEAGYLLWTNRLLSTLRANARKRDVTWAYFQVTERQGRKHPHSHLITTYYPDDLELGTKTTWKNVAGKLTAIPVECLRSDYLGKKCVSAGLGEQYDISEVKTIEGASRYVAKYLFKDSMFATDWPKQWRRVRYSQSFPKRTEKITDAFPLITAEDWRNLAQKAIVIRTQDVAAYEAAYFQFLHDDILIRKPRNETI